MSDRDPQDLEEIDEAWMRDTFHAWKRTIFPSAQMQQSLRVRLQELSGDDRMAEPPVENIIKRFFREIGQLLQGTRDDDDQ